MMQAYIANLSEDAPEKIRGSSYIVYFSGCDFRCPYCYASKVLDFKNEYLVLLKDVKKDIELNLERIDTLVFTGGEPCLQRQAMVELASFGKSKNLKIVIETNGSKTESLRSMLQRQLVDVVYFDFKTPFDMGLFEKVTKSSTFFKTIEELLSDIKETLRLLKDYEGKVTIKIKTIIVPSMIYRKEHLLEMAKYINEIECEWIIVPFEQRQGLVAKHMESISPPTKQFIQNLKEMCLKEYPLLKINSEED